MSENNDQMDFSEDLEHLCDDMESLMDMSDLDDLPTAIIVTSVPASVFTDTETQATFEKMFLDLDSEATFAYLKSFKRVRIQFSSADTAGIARIKNDGAHISGQPIRCYFFQLRTVPSDSQHLQPPKPSKMFLISPPASPPVGWESVPETEPVVNYDLLHAIASLNPGETHELHPSSVDAPSIVVHLCEDPVGFGNHSNLAPPKQKIIGTRRPDNPDISKAPGKRPPVVKEKAAKSKESEGPESCKDENADNPDISKAPGKRPPLVKEKAAKSKEPEDPESRKDEDAGSAEHLSEKDDDENTLEMKAEMELNPSKKSSSKGAKKKGKQK